ncbi:Gfo/Idh/MocA family oxidoreductase [Gammaproteobacteria bacterium]|nr:Gfo/Idh/MocA family oxidoreductase [Gammaproteobacteria bacterium]
MSKTELGLAFIGCGRVANWIATFFESGMDNVRVIAACDPVITKAKELGERLSAEPHASYDDVVCRDDVDIVIIMTESGNHYKHAKLAINSDKHVIVEKPPCMFSEQIIELKGMALERGLMYAPIFQNRFNPSIKILKKSFEDGRFGNLVCASIRLLWCRYQDYYEDGWHGTWAMDGGVINQQAIHHIDALTWICGKVEKVVSFQKNRLNSLEAEDTTVALVEFSDGAVGTIQATTAARPRDMDASLTIIGECGSATVGGIALNEISAWEFTDAIPEDKHVPRKYSTIVENGYGYSHGPLIQEIINRIVDNNYESPIDPESAANTVELVHGLYSSAEQSGIVDFNRKIRSIRLGVGTV